jgi:transposase
MSKCIAERARKQTAAAFEGTAGWSRYAAFIGLDVHKETIAVAVALPGRDEPQYRGEIKHEPKALKRWLQRLNDEFGGVMLLFCYEAGPCGYGLYRQLLEVGHECQVVAPSLIPKKPGERVKTDRRDALKLAQLLRSGDLTAVWVPDAEQEAMRDLTRARNDMKSQERKARQQLNAFVLRHGHHWPRGKTRWTKTHFNWLESIRFEQAWLQVVLQEYIDAVRAATQRVADLTDQLMRALPSWSLAPVVEALVALRGIDTLAATVVLAELGDISRFDSPKQLMAYLGLVPSEHSTGSRRRQGAITLTAKGTPGGCWLSVPGATAFRRARRCTSSARPKRPHQRPRRLPGGRRNACVGVIASSRRRART